MIIISLICVVAAAIALGVGYVTEETSVLYASIAAALVGALFLMIAWFQSRARRKPLQSATIAGDEPGGSATWKGAAWAEGQVDSAGLSRDDAAPPPPEPPADAPTQVIDEAVFKPPASAAKMPPPAPSAPPAAPKPTSSTGWAPPPPPGAAAPDAPKQDQPAPPGTAPPPPPPP